MISDLEIFDIIAQRIEEQRKSVGIVVGVLSPEGSRVLSHGEVAQGDPRPLDGDSVFEAGSLTKVFTCLLLADMLQTRKASLTDPVTKHLPADTKIPARNGRLITMIDLATHTAGLPLWPANAPTLQDPSAADYGIEHLYRFLSTYELPCEIGSQWRYSNVGIALLGHALSNIAGMEYGSLVDTRLVQPLRLTNTGLSLSARLCKQLVIGHNADLQMVPTSRFCALAPATSLLSSTNDLMTLIGTVWGSPKSSLAGVLRATMTIRRPAPTMVIRSDFIRNPEQALGWYVAKYDGREFIGHEGLGAGYAVAVLLDYTAHEAVVIASNTGVTVNDIAWHILTRLPLVVPRREVKLDSSLLDSYAGQFRAPGVIFNVRREGSILMIEMPGRRMRLRPAGEHIFFVPELDFEFEFQKGDDGHVGMLLFRWKGKAGLPAVKVGQAAER